MKYLLMLGFLSLHISQPAVALSDIASGLQSIPSLGYLGDISTGFASVRKISLSLMQTGFLTLSEIVINCFFSNSRIISLWLHVKVFWGMLW